MANRLTIIFKLFKDEMPLWIPVALLALLTRIPILLLPGAGRDEALYFYWSKHPEPAYSPLLQFLLNFFDLLPLPDLTMIRLPSIFAGIVVLPLFEKLLRHREINRRSTLIALLALAFCPWQVYTGAVLHPDNLLLCCLLLFLLAAIRTQYFMGSIAAAMAFWAKPSGILLFPVIVYTLFFSGGTSRKSAVISLCAYLFLVIPVASAFKQEILKAMSEFSRMDPSISFLKGMGVQLITLFLIGGILLPLTGFWGFVQRLNNFFRRAKTDLDLRITLIIALVLLGTFGCAALFFRQIKGNWMLPALVILWPGKPLSKSLSITGLAITLSLSVGTMIAITQPGIIAALEKRLPGWEKTYSLQAGAREARVSATASWSQRYCEYQSINKFLEEVRVAWEEEQPGFQYPEWVVSDDYGLAAQLIFAWSRSEQKLILPKDGIFIRSLPGKNCTKLPGGVLVLAVHYQPGSIWPRLDDVRTFGTARHPLTGREVFLAVSGGNLFSLPETGYFDP
jgi:hypothetical protein